MFICYSQFSVLDDLKSAAICPTQAKITMHRHVFFPPLKISAFAKWKVTGRICCIFFNTVWQYIHFLISSLNKRTWLRCTSAFDNVDRNRKQVPFIFYCDFFLWIKSRCQGFGTVATTGWLILSYHVWDKNFEVISSSIDIISSRKEKYGKLRNTQLCKQHIIKNCKSI